MIHSLDVYAPTYVQGTAQSIGGYTLIYSAVPFFLQPTDSKMEFVYEQRETTISVIAYTSAVQNTYTREQVFLDPSGNQFHLIADPLNPLMSDDFLKLTMERYSEGSKKRLDIEEYP